jgi:hypothetical protein
MAVKEQTKGIFLRVPLTLLSKIDRKARSERRNRQSYILFAIEADLKSTEVGE